MSRAGGRALPIVYNSGGHNVGKFKFYCILGFEVIKAKLLTFLAPGSHQDWKKKNGYGRVVDREKLAKSHRVLSSLMDDGIRFKKKQKK